MFLKNMVVEPWQRFPFVTTLFVAEASCMLMHPSDVHYPAISKLLLHTPGIDVEVFFYSSAYS
jgi:nucleolar pre-ribosomal-associated protein 1